MWIKYLLLLTLCACAPRLQAGFGYAEKIPTTHLTGHEQFHFGAKGVKRINEHINIVAGWDHYSNGAGLGIGRFPNHGLDFYGIDLEYTWQ